MRTKPYEIYQGNTLEDEAARKTSNSLLHLASQNQDVGEMFEDMQSPTRLVPRVRTANQSISLRTAMLRMSLYVKRVQQSHDARHVTCAKPELATMINLP